MMKYKQPRSVQVILFATVEGQSTFLLLKRCQDYGGFWQFVTGSLEEGETPEQAAVREVLEETGMECRKEGLIDLQLTNVFEIAPQWRAKFAPGVTHNVEVCFALQVERRQVRLDAREHQDYGWYDFEQAWALLYWESNKAALAKWARLNPLAPKGGPADAAK